MSMFRWKSERDSEQKKLDEKFVKILVEAKRARNADTMIEIAKMRSVGEMSGIAVYRRSRRHSLRVRSDE